MTAQQLIDASGRIIGELRADRSFGTNESAQLLVSLNDMLAAWSAAGTGIHQMTRDAHTLTGATSYTFGVSGNINTARPIRIEAAVIKSSSDIRREARVVTAAEWAAENEDETAAGDFADILYPDYANPLCTLRLYPAPASGSTLELYSRKALTALASLATTVDFPPGYQEALIYGFAVKIAPEFGKAAPESVLAIASEARAAIAAVNAQLTPQVAQ